MRGVGDASAAVIGEARYAPLRIFVREDDGLVAGLVGGTYWRWLHVESLWVREPHRGRGLGTELMTRAEAEAVVRGCEAAYLDTYSAGSRAACSRRSDAGPRSSPVLVLRVGRIPAT